MKKLTKKHELAPKHRMKPEKSKKKKSTMKLEEDERYQTIVSDPIFKEMRRKDRKITIDDRFKGMFTDKRFSAKRATIDKRGRAVELSGKSANLENLYELSSEDDGSEEATVSGVEDSDDDEEIRETKIHLDLARGEGNLISSTEDEDSEDDSFGRTEGLIGEDWNELDKPARRVEWASRRLAICNMDWDRIRADDLLVLLSSFKPPDGKVISLTVYLSDYGTEKLAEEEIKGPVLDRLVGANKKIDLDSDDLDDETKAAIRAYQLDRLRYYYAVMECDSEHTATSIYEACDGVEYEASRVRMDLRFIPDEMDFEESRIKEIVRTSDLNVEKYKPRRFENMALANCRAKLTWDEADPYRKQIVSEAFDKEKDLNGYEDLIAPGSEEDEEQPINPQDTLKVLFESAGIDHGRNEDDREEEDLEIEWEPELGEMEAESRKKKKSKDSDGLTPFQQYEEKRRQKKKEYKAKVHELKKQRKRELAEAESEVTERHTASLKKKKPKSDQLASILPVDVEDDRFTALFTHSAFAIDKTNPNYKNGTLADVQVVEKIKRAKRPRHMEKVEFGKMNEEDEKEDLVEKLKKKSEKLQRKRKAMKE